MIAHGEAGATNLASGTMFSSATDNFFNTDFSKQELTAPSSVLSAENAVFAHEPSDAFPASSLAVTNDYADMAFRRGLVG
ncbi:MAG TPA: hypothetical protein VNS34_28020 [Rhizobiaceae bacterium]|nr:hypothetical protein [Rhizobiaceae bacterium]